MEREPSPKAAHARAAEGPIADPAHADRAARHGHRNGNDPNAHAIPATVDVDVCLLLRAHAESALAEQRADARCCASSSSATSIPDEQLGAALAYLEVLWIEACARAAETDAARVELDALGGARPGAARRRPAATTPPCAACATAIERRVCRLLAVPERAAAATARVRRRRSAPGERSAGS